MTEEDARRLNREIEHDWQLAIEAVHDQYEDVAKGYETLEKDWRKTIKEQDRRIHRANMICLIVCVGTLVACVAGLVAFAVQGHDIKTSRLSASEDACKQRNHQAVDQAAFVTSLAPQAGRLARAKFKVQPDCKAYARASVTGRSLPDPVPQPSP